MKNKKIIILALVLLILAGIIVVGLKGFNVDFMLKQHDSIEYSIDTDYQMSDVENIAKEVFGKKSFKIRKIELFNDAISINADSITNEEAENLIKKLDEKYKNTNSDEKKDGESEEQKNTDYVIISNPKVKLSSLFMVYLLPSVVAGLVILCYEAIRYRKLNGIKIVLQVVVLESISFLALLSLIAITRFPINLYVFPSIIVILLIELLGFNIGKEKELKKLDNQ